jgi:hypothetical protein
MTLVMKTYTHALLHPCSAHMQSATICHLGMSRFYHALDPYSITKTNLTFNIELCEPNTAFGCPRYFVFLHATNSTKIECNRHCQLTVVLLLGFVKGWTYHTSYAMHTFCNLFVILRCVIFCHYSVSLYSSCLLTDRVGTIFIILMFKQ